MGRAKSRMELIGNEKERRTTFEKRKKGLEKAAYELSTLCGVGVGMIFYDNESNEPKIWPSHEAVARLINSYRSRTNFDSRYRSYDLTAYFNDRRQRIQDNIKKLREKTREVKYPKWDDKYNSLSQDELKKFDRMLMAKIDAVKERISLIKGSRNLFTDVFMNSPVQQSAIFVPSNTQQQQPLTYYNTSDALMNPSVQGGSISMPNIIQQHQPLEYYNTSDVSMNASVQESAIFMPDIIQQQQPFPYYDNQDHKRNLMEGSRNLYLESEFSKNHSVQGSVYFMPDIIRQQQPQAYYDTQDNIGNSEGKNTSFQENAIFMPDLIQKQQPLVCYDTQANKGNLMERSRNLHFQSNTSMNPSVQGSAFFMPDIVRQQQPLAYYDAQNRMGNWGKMMMMNDGASCSQVPYS